MQFSDYQTLAHKTSRFAGESHHDYNMLMATLGLAGETGEVCDIIKKVIFHGHTLDSAKLEAEIGDVLWYLAELCTALKLDFNSVACNNLAKLKERYGEKFSSEASINRAS